MDMKICFKCKPFFEEILFLFVDYNLSFTFLKNAYDFITKI